MERMRSLGDGIPEEPFYWPAQEADYTAPPAEVIVYFKEMAREPEIPYQSLINLYSMIA